MFIYVTGKNSLQDCIANHLKVMSVVVNSQVITKRDFSNASFIHSYMILRKRREQSIISLS